MKHLKKINEFFTTEGFVAFRIPDDKREEYFNFVNKLKEHAPLSASDSNWDATNDPIVIIHDMTMFSQKNQEAINNFMTRIGAKDVTEMYL